MFREQFTQTAREQKELSDLCIFFSRVYIKAHVCMSPVCPVHESRVRIFFTEELVGLS